MSLITMARHLLASFDAEKAAADSFTNYHVFGLDYLCLHRNPRLTIKAYFLSAHVEGVGHDGWLVSPHNHRYAFEHVTVAGTFENLTFSLGGDLPIDVYAYSAEARTPKIIGEATLSKPTVERTNAGDSFAMFDPMRLHTLRVWRPNDTEPAIALQAQYHDVREQTMLVTPRGAGLKKRMAHELYKPMWKHRAAELAEKLKGAIQ